MVCLLGFFPYYHILKTNKKTKQNPAVFPYFIGFLHNLMIHSSIIQQMLQGENPKCQNYFSVSPFYLIPWSLQSQVPWPPQSSISRLSRFGESATFSDSAMTLCLNSQSLSYNQQISPEGKRGSQNVTSPHCVVLLLSSWPVKCLSTWQLFDTLKRGFSVFYSAFLVVLDLNIGLPQEEK